jgi:spore photoproduct lyase
MYPSANLVVFVNLEDIFSQVKILLKKHPVYLCVSYDTDLMALEHVLGYVKEWFHFALEHPDLTIEIRTKSVNMKIFDELKPLDNVILAWTLSPQGITEKIEHHTPTLKQRLECIHKAVQIGFQVRLCFDPMLYCPDWKREYQGMIDTVFDQIPADRIKDVSTGVFRVSQDYMKQMRKQAPYSSIIQFPFENDVGVYHYSKELSKNMVTFIVQLLSRTIPKDNIFIWNEVSE